MPSRLVVLPSGDVPVVHGRVDREPLERYREIERRHLARALAG